MNIAYFRTRRPGPEMVLEDIIIKSVENILIQNDLPYWIACSLPIGAGLPDVLLAFYEPQILAYKNLNISKTQLLAMLRAVNTANYEEISKNLICNEKVIYDDLNDLVNMNIVSDENGVFSIVPLWKNILPRIVAIEVKVDNWKRAIAQAKRNRIFCNQSYIALPEKTSKKIKESNQFQNAKIGLLSINDFEEVNEEVSAPIGRPMIWEYYYKLAMVLAKDLNGEVI